MRIGTPIYTWDDCGKCVHFDTENGCTFDPHPEHMVDEGECAIVCLSGQTSLEPDYGLDIDFEEPWE